MSKKIYNILEYYKERYQISLPPLANVKYTTNNKYWAEFMSEDLYRGIYILYVNNSLLKQNEMFIKQILFHEFTHLTDSIDLKKYPLDYFKNAMSSYSEFHASQREMIERLEQLGDVNINENTQIMHAESLTLKSFINQSFDKMNEWLNKMANNKSKNDFLYNTVQIFYYFGYLSAIRMNNINYEFPIYKVNPHFYLIMQQIYESLITDHINISDVVNLFEKLNKDILFLCGFNMHQNK